MAANVGLFSWGAAAAADRAIGSRATSGEKRIGSNFSGSGQCSSIICVKAGLTPTEVQRFWLHQANLGMNQLIARKLLGRDATADDAPVILDEFGNTASAGSIIAFHRHHSDISAGRIGVLHGNRTYVICDDDGQITETHSISAGLDYPGVGPEHAYLKDIGRAEYVGITDKEALEAFHRLCRTEGIIPALESSHAVAYAMKLAATMRPDQHILVNLSGRGDKDIGTVADLTGAEFFCRPSCRGQSVKGGQA